MEGGVFLLGVRQLPGYAGQGGPGHFQELLEDRTKMRIRSIHSKRDGGIRARLNELWDMGEEILGS